MFCPACRQQEELREYHDFWRCRRGHLFNKVDFRAEAGRLVLIHRLINVSGESYCAHCGRKDPPAGDCVLPEYIAVRTRTGDEIHIAHSGGTTTLCGKWLQHDAPAMIVVGQPVTCESCLRSNRCNLVYVEAQ